MSAALPPVPYVTPEHTLAEAKAAAEAVLAENYSASDGPWEVTKTKYEEIPFVYNKVNNISKEKVPVYVTRADYVIDGTPEEVFNTFWLLTAKWKVGTVSSVETLESTKTTQTLYEAHKTLSAATAKRDLVYQSQVDRSSDGSIFVTSVSTTHPSKPNQDNYERSHLVYSGFKIIPNGEKSSVQWVFCFDFKGWIHAKWTQAEFSKVALRLRRIGTNLIKGPSKPSPAAAPAPAPAPAPVSAPPAGSCCSAPGGDGRFCSNCGEMRSAEVRKVF
eukprot:TRINITY_DN176_c2_g1_i1.p1 TRINITY_DN176_c2_g1~~TRINITY_DN176_c2_g1_i1.p1  ORF type:complete len:274 (-),score=87.29 TRINITY_DN176_c2_g1_i1:400-1221(-)